MRFQVGTRGRLTSTEAESLWRAWVDAGEVAARNTLVIAYTPLVRYLARRKARDLPEHSAIEEDLVSCGLVALIAAVDRWDPSRGASFEQFAWTRVSGALLDELRRVDWAPRSVRRSARRIARAEEKIQAEKGRMAHERELAQVAGITVDQLRRDREGVVRAALLSLNSCVIDVDAESIEMLDTIPSTSPSTDPARACIAADRAAALASALDQLGATERVVVEKIYLQEMSGRDVAREMGVSESRVSQILGSARRRLRVHLTSD